MRNPLLCNSALLAVAAAQSRCQDGLGRRHDGERERSLASSRPTPESDQAV